MAKDVKTFIEELTNYINTCIVGTETTYITGCSPEGPLMNRGHAIPIYIKTPKEEDDEWTGIGPVFYAEELMSQYPKQSIAAIGEFVNARINEAYPQMVEALRTQRKALHKTRDQYQDEDLIVTALPMAQLGDMDEKTAPYVIKTRKDLGLSLALKGRTCVNPEDSTQSYFAPICADREHPVLESDWQIAETNSLCYADIRFVTTPLSGLKDWDPSIPILGAVKDDQKFYDWFYLISAPTVWQDLGTTLHARKIYIFPVSPYAAKFLLDTTDIEKIVPADIYAIIREQVMINERPSMYPDMPVFVYDVEKQRIARLEDAE